MELIGELFSQALRLHRSGNLAQAEALYRQILKADPEHADTHSNLGSIFGQAGQFAEAAACFRETLRIDANHANAHYNLGTALAGQERHAEAVESFQQALRIEPGRADARRGLANALNNLGHDRGRQGQFAEAAECYRQALALVPGHAMALWNQALLSLQQGDFASGWQHFHLRETLPGMVPRSFRQPRWDGTPFDGKTILVYAEKGFGDTLQMIRYLPLLQRCGGKVVLECQPALVRLLTGIAGVDQLVPAGAPLPSFDVEAPLFNLPCLFGTTLSAIPANIPYLAADPKLTEHWRVELTRLLNSASTADVVIGIVWQGSLLLSDYHRSAPVSHFEALARIPRVRLVSLQKGPGTEQLQALERRFPIIDLDDKLDTEAAFVDTAAVMMNLDLVITVDTATAHLAGALGVPVWTALEFVPDWRWLLDRSDSPWYPTMRLFRQRKPGDWGEVFARIAKEVRSEERGVRNQEKTTDFAPDS